MDEDELEDATDSDDPKQAVIELLLSIAHPLPESAQHSQADLRVELEGLRLKELRGRAKHAGVDEDALEDATDSEDPKQAIIDAIVMCAAASTDCAVGDSELAQLSHDEAAGQAVAALRQELAGLKLRALKKRARELGVSDEAIEDAEDGDDVQGAVTGLCIDAAVATAGGGVGGGAEDTVAALRAVKEAVDPDNIFCVGNNVLKRE